MDGVDDGGNRDDDPVLAALVAALEANDHPDLRIAVARHLLTADRPAEALGHAQQALATRPADLDALGVAVEAAESGGQTEAAAGYRQLLTGLGGQAKPADLPFSSTGSPSRSGEDAAPDPADEPRPEPLRTGAPDGGADSDDDDFDTFLREVLAEDRAARIELGDVGGMSQVKAELERRFFLPIRNPEIQKAYGKPLNGGLLLYGPPGCGKTFLARAIAGELDANFLPLTLHEVLDMWMGQSERNLHAIFQAARETTPTVLFLDEVDAIGQKRSRSAGPHMRVVVAQLLNELDGAVDRNDGVFVIGATNAPWDVDPALRRPGRFDRTILVLPPDEQARISILAYHLRERPTENLDLAKVAAKTTGLTGADLMLICETAVEYAMERAVKSGQVAPIDQKLLEKAAKSVKPSVGPWLDTARNYVTFANEDGEYDELERYIKSQKR